MAMWRFSCSVCGRKKGLLRPRVPSSVICECGENMTRATSLPKAMQLETIDNRHMMRPVEQIGNASELADDRIEFYENQKKDVEILQGGPSEQALELEEIEMFGE